MFTIQERTAVVSARLRGMSYEKVREDFVQTFKNPGDSRQVITPLNKLRLFVEGGGVMNSKLYAAEIHTIEELNKE